MPRSSAVTTEQIVRMMKRGENGSINVSMGPSGRLPVYPRYRRQRSRI
jgi:hypothetical protein